MRPQAHKPRARYRDLFALVTLLFLQALLASACTEADGEFLVDVGKSWAQQKGLLTADGNPTAKAGLKVAQKAILGTTGDSELDAAIDAGKAVKTIHDADAAADEGVQMGGDEGLAKIEEAINLRPNDWSYWEKMGAVLMAEGRTEEARQAFDESNSLVQQHIDAGGDCQMYTRNQLYQRQDALTTQVQRYYDLGQDPPAAVQSQLQAVQGRINALQASGEGC